MKIIILNESFIKIDEIESFSSAVWTDRYVAEGEFEITLNPEAEIINSIKDGYYLQTDLSEKTMIIQSIHSEYEEETGTIIPVSGNSLETILHWRCITPMMTLTGNLQMAVKRIFDENIISPVNPDRRIPNFVFKMSTDPKIKALTIDTQFTGDEIYDAVVKLCEANKIGFRVILKPDNKFEFELISGSDRSFSQETNPYVTFSPSFKNLKSSKYLYSSKDHRNVAYIAGEGEGLDRKYSTIGTGTGLSRKELFVDARDISSNNDETPMSLEDYNKLLNQRGAEKLAECTIVAAFEGEVYESNTYVYGTDFYSGDIVQLENGFDAKVRVTEMVITYDDSGLKMTPTFLKVE